MKTGGTDSSPKNLDLKLASGEKYLAHAATRETRFCTFESLFALCRVSSVHNKQLPDPPTPVQSSPQEYPFRKR